jgi:hypothetical protein
MGVPMDWQLLFLLWSVSSKMSRREQKVLKHLERMGWIGVGVMILIVSVMSVIALGGMF